MRWDKADVNSYYYYTGQYLEPYLQQVDEVLKLSGTIPLEAIDNLYNGIVSVLTSGAKQFVPTCRRNFYKFWWDQGLDTLKDAAINSDKIWKAAGKPCQGSLFDKRQRCRAQYRKIRDGQKLDSMSYTNHLHDALLAKDGPSFWKSWRSKFETRSRCMQVDGCVEPEVIDDNFARYFSNIYSPNSQHRAESLCNALLHDNYFGFPLEDYGTFDTELGSKIIFYLKCGKAADINGLTAEHLLQAHPSLTVILSKLFRLCVLCKHVPASFGHSYIVPLPKIRTALRKACHVKILGA